MDGPNHQPLAPSPQPLASLAPHTQHPEPALSTRTRHRIRGMKRAIIPSLLLFAFFVCTAFAEEKTIAIKAARLVDGRGQQAIAPAVVVVRGNKIESVGRDVP